MISNGKVALGIDLGTTNRLAQARTMSAEKADLLLSPDHHHESIGCCVSPVDASERNLLLCSRAALVK